MTLSKASYQAERPEVMESDIPVFENRFAECTGTSHYQKGISPWDPITGLHVLLLLLDLY